MAVDVAFVVFDGMTLLDLVGVYDPVTRLDIDGYREIDHEVVCLDPPTADLAGLAVEPDRVGPRLDHDLVVVPGGRATRSLRTDEAFLDWLGTASQSDRLASVCTGSLLLGAAGFLEGREATTHPSAYDLLEPYCAEVREDRIVADGQVVTARGVASSLDLGLWLCEELAGPTAAAEVGERMDYPPPEGFGSAQ
jgi:transcriptional regulator GlxA family with amidase domain